MGTTFSALQQLSWVPQPLSLLWGEFLIIVPIFIKGTTFFTTGATCHSEQLPIGSSGLYYVNLFLYYRNKFPTVTIFVIAGAIFCIFRATLLK